MQTLLKIGLGMVVLAVILVGTTFGVLRAHDIDGTARNGSRAMKSETRKVGTEVNIIILNGPIDLTLKQGATPSMVAIGEERLLPRVQTVQEGNTLTIALKESLFHLNRPLRVELTLPTLQQLTVHGSGDSAVGGFSGDALVLAMHGSGDVRFDGAYRHVHASLSGSGDLELALANGEDVDLSMLGSGSVAASGQSKSLIAHLMGSGDLAAEKMQADAVAIDVMGSGDANVYAKQSATLDVKGSGDIDVHGNPPHRQVSRMGSGDVSWAKD